jgi:hypothetical protein
LKERKKRKDYEEDTGFAEKRKANHRVNRGAAEGTETA